MLRFAPAALLLALSGCVAPEAPEPPKVVRTAPAVDLSAGRFQAAPTPNRAVGRPSSDEVVRIAH